MLNTSQFFGGLVSQYVERYNRIADQFGARASQTASPPPASTSSALDTPAQPSLGAGAPSRDSALLAQSPQLEAPTTDSLRNSQDGLDLSALSDKEQPATTGAGEALPEIPEGSKTPATYSNSFTKMRYKLKMEFDMQAIQQTVHQLSSSSGPEGTVTDESFESLFAGGFGLKTDFKLSGVSVNSTTTNPEGATKKYRHNEHIQRGRGMHRAAGATKHGLPKESQQSYQVAVNRISLRYKSDTQFSMNHFSRFQSHVEQLGSVNPEAVAPYADNAGALAQSASNEVVGQFFDTVDGYLENKEASLIENAEKFFDMAAESLGLSPEALEAAKASVTGRIEGFFDSVDESLATLQGQFAGQAAPGESLIEAPVSLDGSELAELAEAPQVEPEENSSILNDILSQLEASQIKENADERAEAIEKFAEPSVAKLESERIKESPVVSSAF